MKSRFNFVILACLVFVATDGSSSTIIRQGRRDGSIVRQDNGFPFVAIENWVAATKRLPRFDEAGFRKTHSREDVARFIKDVECVRVGYVSDGMVIEGFILKPRSLEARAKLLVVIYNRGGNQDLAIIDYEKLYSLRKFVYAGYIVVASQYRGGRHRRLSDGFVPGL